MKILAPIDELKDIVSKEYVDGKFLSGLSINGDKLQYTLNGANTLLTIPYASNANKLGGTTLSGLFTALTSNATNAISITVGGTTKNITPTTLKNSLALNNVENTKLSTWTGTGNITTLGTITSGTWNGTKIANGYLANSTITIAGTSVLLGGDISKTTLQSNLDIVTISGEQTVSGAKTFSSLITADGGISVKAGQALTFLDAKGNAHSISFDSENGAFHFDTAVYSDGSVSALGKSNSEGGSGVNIDWLNFPSNLIPDASNTRYLGSSSKPWHTLYTTNVECPDNDLNLNANGYIYMLTDVKFGAAGRYSIDSPSGVAYLADIYSNGQKVATESWVSGMFTPITTHNALVARVTSLEGGSALSVVTTGSGNAITSISKSGTQITANKGTTFLTVDTGQKVTGTKTIANGTNSNYIAFRPSYATNTLSGGQISVHYGANSVISTTRFGFRTYSYDAAGATTHNAYYEEFYLPAVDVGRTSSVSYNIYTSKNFIAGTNYISPSGLTSALSSYLNTSNYTTYTPIINGSHATKDTSIYAPTSAGSWGDVLRSNGTGAPSWVAQSSLNVGYLQNYTVRNNVASGMLIGKNVTLSDTSGETWYVKITCGYWNQLESIFDVRTSYNNRNNGVIFTLNGLNKLRYRTTHYNNWNLLGFGFVYSGGYSYIYLKLNGYYADETHYATCSVSTSSRSDNIVVEKVTEADVAGITWTSLETNVSYTDGTIYANKFVGSLEGNADSATSATYLKPNNTKNLGLEGTLQLYRAGIFGDEVDEWNSPYGNYTNTSGVKVDYGTTLRLRYSPSYYRDVWFDANHPSIVYRNITNKVSSGWVTILDSSNYATYLNPSYVKKGGDTMTGQLSFSGTTYPHICGNGDFLILSAASDRTYSVAIDKIRYGFRPENNNNTYLGTNSYRWKEVYSVLGNFSGQITSSVADGTAPFVVASKTMVSNLNADMLDGKHLSDILYNEKLVYDRYNRLFSFRLSNGEKGWVVFRVTTASNAGNATSLYHIYWKYNSTISDDKNIQVKCVYTSGTSHRRNSIHVARRTTSLDGSETVVGGFDVFYDATGSGMHGTYEMLSFSPNVRFLTRVPVLATEEEVFNGEFTSAADTLFVGNIDGNAATAEKFKTARTIWGQSFDGSGNVSGALSGVTTITGASSSSLLIHSSGSQSIGLAYNGDGTKAVVLNSAQFKPYDSANGLLDLGTTSARWKGIYGQTLNLSGDVTIGDTLSVTGVSTSRSNILYNSYDATLKVYAIDTDSLHDYGNETVAIQTCFDGKDPETHTYVTDHEYRCNLVLQPRGGQVYVGYTPTEIQTTYALNVQQGLRLEGNANGSNSPLLTFYRDGRSSWNIVNIGGNLYIQNNYTTAVQSSYFNVFTLNHNTGDATLKGTLTSGTLLPTTNGTYYLGRTDRRWHTGYFTGAINIGAANSTSISGSNTTVGVGYIDLAGSTPFIDFHYGNSTADYTSRIIESASGRLSVNGSLFNTGGTATITTLNVTTIKVGGTNGVTITWDSINKALKFDKPIYSTGSVSALGISTTEGGTGSIDLLSVPSNIIASTTGYNLGSSAIPWSKIYGTTVYTNTISANSGQNLVLSGDYIMTATDLVFGTSSDTYYIDTYGRAWLNAIYSNGQEVATQNYVIANISNVTDKLVGLESSIGLLETSTFTGAYDGNNNYVLTWFTASGGGRNVTLPTYSDSAESGLSDYDGKPCLMDSYFVDDIKSWVQNQGYLTSIGSATTNTLGLLKVSNKLTTAVTLTSGNGTTSNRYYGVQMDSNGVAFVNVPWTNTVVSVMNSLTSTSTTAALSANQGKVLKDYHDVLDARVTTLEGAGYITSSALSGYAKTSDLLLTSEQSSDSFSLRFSTNGGSSYSSVGMHVVESIDDVPTAPSLVTELFIADILDIRTLAENAVTKTGTDTITGAKTFSGTSATMLTIDRNSTNPALIRFMKNGSTLGYLGVDNNKNAVFNNGNSVYYLTHNGNIASQLSSMSLEFNNTVTFNDYTTFTNDVFVNAPFYIENQGMSGREDGNDTWHIDSSGDAIFEYLTCTNLDQSSDMTKKNRLHDVELSLTDIANAPAFHFLWNNGKNSRGMQVGTSAQYWQTVLPEVVSGTEGSLTINYSVLGVVSSILIAREVVDTKDRVARLEERVKALEAENEELRKLIA